MADKVGGDILSLQGSSGSVVDENGETIVSTDTGGGSSYILGPTLIRAIVGGVANGDFAKPPLGAETAISDENPLPYWTWVDSTSSGRITAALVANGSAASGNVLRFTAVGAQTGDKVYLERYVSVLGSQARTLTYQPRSVWSSATSNANLVAFTEAAFVKNDGSTVTGGSASGTANGTAIAGSTFAREVQANPNTNGAVPSDGAFIRLRFGLSFSAAVAGTATADACEVRIDTGFPQLLLTDNAAPQTYGYGVVYLNNGILWIRANETGVSGTNPSIYLSSSSGSIYIDPTGTGTAQVLGSASIAGDLSATGSITVGTDLNLDTRHTIKSNNASTVLFTRNDTGNRSGIVVGRVFPGDQTTRYIEDDGTRTSFSGGIDVNSSSTLTSATFSSSIVSTLTGTAFNATGNGDVSLSGGGDVLLTGADTSVPITGNGELKAIPNTTTLTTNSARWVLISGNQYGLRRDSSTRRVKTNIVEADDAVLAAAKNLRAVHYEALEKDEEGNVVPSGKHTLGLIAEEIQEAGLGCAVTYDGEGLPDGYDERVIIAALLHRVNDLEARLSALEGA